MSEKEPTITPIETSPDTTANTTWLKRIGLPLTVALVMLGINTPTNAKPNNPQKSQSIPPLPSASSPSVRDLQKDLSKRSKAPKMPKKRKPILPAPLNISGVPLIRNLQKELVQKRALPPKRVEFPSLGDILIDSLDKMPPVRNLQKGLPDRF
ncbi:MAG: hypothetical protein GWP15_02220 [Nitrospirae bacterium]|nr:hypothetical protein [Nitrospirota bacterium]